MPLHKEVKMLKPQKHEQRIRNDAIRHYHQTHPKSSYETLAQIWGLSKQRIWDICNPKAALAKKRKAQRKNQSGK